MPASDDRPAPAVETLLTADEVCVLLKVKKSWSVNASAWMAHRTDSHGRRPLDSLTCTNFNEWRGQVRPSLRSAHRRDWSSAKQHAGQAHGSRVDGSRSQPWAVALPVQMRL